MEQPLDAKAILSASGAEPSKKFIRTFHGDMETIEKGGTPDLAPFPAEAEQVSVHASLIPPQSPPQEVVSIPEQTVEPVAVIEKQPEPLKTYAGDFADRITEKQASVVTVLAAEQDAKSGAPETPVPEQSRSTIAYSIAGVLLLLVGGVGTYVAYTRYLATNMPVVLAPVAFAPIFVDEREIVSGKGTPLIQMVAQLVTRQLSPGTVRQLYFETATTSVFSALQLPVPGILARNIVDADSMAGVISTGANSQSPFFILSVTSFSNTFSGMLQWEPLLLRDVATLYPPFVEKRVAQTASTTTATSTTQGEKQTVPVVQKPLTFIDAVVANHDVRVYRDASGRERVMYGYWDQTTLVIARDTAAFTEILRRLATSRTKR